MNGHFVLDQYQNRIPVVRMYNYNGRLTTESARAFEIEIQLPNGAIVDFSPQVEHSVHILQ